MIDYIVDIDYALIQYINQFAGHKRRMDILAGLLTDNDLVKTGLMILAINWAWFRQSEKQKANRAILVTTCIGVTISILIARLIAIFAPFRYRPEYDPKLDFVLPYNATPATLDGWSSFPSDHAAMYFALSIGLYFISKKVGFLAILFATICICFSRVYMGYHFLSDVVAGAIIGTVTSVVAVRYLSNLKLTKMLVKAADIQPEYFYPFFVLFMALLYDMFWGARDLASTVHWILTV